jgi:GNAT superfamily N-acetyltransferase
VSVFGATTQRYRPAAVSAPEIRPLADEHLDDAAALLARRHARHLAVEPLLPDRYTNVGSARHMIEEAWRADDASGFAAFRSGRLVGYLLGSPRDDPIWGANVWIESGGHAVEEAEDVRDLYAAAAAQWVEGGHTRHYALVPANDSALVQAWFRLSFGQQQAHGVREVPATVDVQIPDGFTIREPTVADIEALIDVDRALPLHQRGSPVFGGAPGAELPTREDSREEWNATLAAREEKILVGFRDDAPVACWSVMPIERSREHRDLLRPERACFLGFASTLPETRGSGIGVVLTNAMLDWAGDEGYRVMVTDWRVTNLLASRFWPSRGFRESFLRLYRSIP